jgi:hypothetical protein
VATVLDIGIDSPVNATATLVPVPSWLVARTWPEVVRLADRALAHGGGRYTAEDFFRALVRREMQLWIVREGEQTAGLVITELRNYPRRRCCRYLLLAGRSFDRWHHLQDEIECWARANGCAAMEMCGRRGWERKLRGWRATHVEMTKEL